jgi:hypothetical protein
MDGINPILLSIHQKDLEKQIRATYSDRVSWGLSRELGSGDYRILRERVSKFRDHLPDIKLIVMIELESLKGRKTAEQKICCV